jgi:hypothetical protein
MISLDGNFSAEELTRANNETLNPPTKTNKAITDRLLESMARSPFIRTNSSKERSSPAYQVPFRAGLYGVT